MPLHYGLIPVILVIHVVFFLIFRKKWTYGKRLFRTGALAVGLLVLLALIIYVLPYWLSQGDVFAIYLILSLLYSFVVASVIYFGLAVLFYLLTRNEFS